MKGNMPKQKNVTLTLAQLALLRELPTRCSDTYVPAQKLVAVGMAEAQPSVFSNPLYVRTKSGDEYLAAHPESVTQ